MTMVSGARRSLGERVEGHGLGSDFAAVACALRARGVDIALRTPSRAGGAPHLRTGDAFILWQGRNDPEERARALESGAQDVVGPWMHVVETVARIVRLARRAPSQLTLGDLWIDLIAREVRRCGRCVKLIPREYLLLVYLARRHGETISRAELLAAIWGLSFDPGTNSVEVHMSRLRAKLDRGFALPMLHTVKGKGYRLHVLSEASSDGPGA